MSPFGIFLFLVGLVLDILGLLALFGLFFFAVSPVVEAAMLLVVGVILDIVGVVV
jgi:hypothetical protein